MGLIHVDAGVVIGLLDANDAHHEAATGALADVARSGDRLAMAASAFAECLVGPSRHGDRAVDTAVGLFQRLPIDVPRPEQATLGGIAAANVSGARRYGFGALRDYVIGISAVNDQGQEFKAGGPNAQ